MTKQKITRALLYIAVAPLFVACVGSPKHSSNDFVYNGHSFGPNRNADYKSGVLDGCKTSTGNYTKNHGKFKLDIDYHNGWEHGRLKCKGNGK